MFFKSKFHDYLQYFVEFVGWKAFDVLSAGIEVATDVCEDGKMDIDRGSIPPRRFQDRSRLVGKPSRIRSSSVMVWSNTVSTPIWEFSLRMLIFSLLLLSSNFRQAQHFPVANRYNIKIFL